MKNTTYLKLLLFILVVLATNSCGEQSKLPEEPKASTKQNEELFISVLKKHLNAVSNKNYDALQSTMSPKGNMELIQPGAEIVYTVDGFMQFHKDWFGVPNWTVSTKILSAHIGDKIGVATTEFLYKEAERDGKPYYNRLIVSYTLEKTNNNWYFIKDHASSIEKTEK